VSSKQFLRWQQAFQPVRDRNLKDSFKQFLMGRMAHPQSIKVNVGAGVPARPGNRTGWKACATALNFSGGVHGTPYISGS